MLVPLSPEDKSAYGAAIDRDIDQLLHVVGPALGLLVILFGTWDAWIDALHASTTLRIRVGLVVLGAPAYARGRLGLPSAWRTVLLFATHVGAMTISAALLDQGLVLALPGLTGALFLLSLIEPRLRKYLGAALAPATLFITLGALMLPWRVYADCVLLYALSLLLACGVALVVDGLRRRAFLAEKALTHAARYDSLTGAVARGYLEELANHDVALALRHGHPLAVAMLDIDFFKRVNDNHGHATGDRVLAAMAGACRKAMRSSDYLGRVGGEEFVCVMPETKLDDAIACAERIRQSVAAMSVPAETGPLRVTISVGVAALDASHGDWNMVLAAADAALYRAKASGRNRTVADDACAQ